MELKEIDQMMEFSDIQANFLRKKYCIDSFIELIDQTMLQSIQNIYNIKAEGLDIIQYTRFFMNCIEHNKKQAPFLAAGLRHLFQTVSQGSSKIKFSHLTDFLCEKILQKDSEGKQLQMKWIPVKSYEQKNNKYLKNAPLIKGGKMEQVPKVGLGKLFADKGKHENLITQAHYSMEQKKIFCLESLSDWIGIYNEDTKLERKIRPSNFHVKKDSAVLKIAFSERQERLGAILKDFSISFWDSTDNYQYEKSINTTKYCQDLQTNIWYLQYFDKWLTADAFGNIYHWNLQEQLPQQHYKCRFRSKINDVCQIPVNSLIAVIQEQKLSHGQHSKIQLISLNRGQIISEIDIKNEKRMLHTLKYSQEYQILLSAGFEKKISLFEINNQYLDSSLKGELLGHQSVVSSMTIISKSPMVVSADDKGKIKIWNIKNFKCMQTIDFSDKVVITKLLDMASQKKIAVVGSRITLLYLQNSPQEIKPIFPIKSQQMDSSLAIFTPSDMRIYDINSGKLLQIDCKSYQDIKSEVTYAIILQNKELVTGNQKGQITFHCRACRKNNKTRSWHTNAIQYLQEDVINKLLISYSDQEGLVVSRLNDGQNEQLRSLKSNFVGRQLISICFSSYHSLLAFISDNIVYLCDYEQFKITFQLTLKDQDSTALTILNGLGLIIVGTNLGNIYVFELNESQLTLTQLLKINTKKPNITHLITNLQCFKNSFLEVSSCTIISSFQNGQIHLLDISEAAKGIDFKNSRINHANYHPYKQLRQRFDYQIKKKLYESIQINKEMSEYQAIVSCMPGHKGGVTSLRMTQFDQHFLISTGLDNRVKIWKEHTLLGDTNINLPLPYLWDLRISEKKKDTKMMIQGLQLIQAIVKRFGKDISLGESQLFKFTAPNMSESDGPSIKKSTMRRKVTLFQDEFSCVDKNYDVIKRNKIFQIGGPSLKRMQVTKKFNTMQRQWKLQQQLQEKHRGQLMKSIETKVMKNDEKQVISMIFKDRTNDRKLKECIQVNPLLKHLEERLDKSIQKVEYAKALSSNRFHKPFKTTNAKLLSLKSKVIDPSETLETRTNLEHYFTSTQSKFMQSSICMRSLNTSSSKIARQNVFLQQQGLSSRKENLNNILKEMKQRLSKSKKSSSNVCQQKFDQGILSGNGKKTRNIRFNNIAIVGQLQKQINLYRISQLSSK